jgi:molecular chaperone DnaJ
METELAFEALGLEPDASDAQVKAAWRRLAAAWHPDRNSAADALARMQAINKAYQHIRLVRDGDGDGDGDGEGEPSPDPAPQATAAQCHVHRRTVRLSLEDTILGCTRTLRGHFTHTCTTCSGAGVVEAPGHCTTCQGQGTVRRPTLFGWLWTDEACTACGGEGRTRSPCTPCEGSGRQTVAYRRQVRFPAGTRHGHTLRVPPSRHADLEIELELAVEVPPHPLFTLDDNGVLGCSMPVNGYAWMCGQWVEVPTPDGLQQMRLHRDARVYRLAGQGFPAVPNGPRGDFLVSVEPVFPPLDDPAQQALLDQLVQGTSRAAQADAGHPLGDWQQRLRRWDRG